MDLDYREMEGLAPYFTGRIIDHLTFGKNFKRLRPGHVGLVLGLLRRRLKGLVEIGFYFVDSTSISTPRLKARGKALKRAREREFYKLHVLAGYSSKSRALVVFAARVTRPKVADGNQLGYLLSGLDGGGRRLLGDSAYDWRRNIELALKRGFRPRRGVYRGLLRKEVLRDFRRNRTLYRRRAPGAIFAGIENR